MRASIPALDGLRGIAILLVLIIHVHVDVLTDSRVDRFVDFWQSGGWLGVDLFFVLSGFLITGVLLDSKGGGGYFSRFYARRALRIWPLYYLVLGFLFLVVPHLGTLFRVQGMQGREWWWLLFLTNIDDVYAASPPRRFEWFGRSGWKSRCTCCGRSQFCCAVHVV